MRGSHRSDKRPQHARICGAGRNKIRCRVRHSGSIHRTSRSFNLADRDARHCCHGGQAGHTDGLPTNIDRRQGGGLECSACVQKSKPAIHDDLVQRRFVADRPNTLWVTDITEHCTSAGTVHCCAMLDVYSQMIVGWSIADHVRTDLVVDALQMACWRRRPPPGTICHGNQGNTLPGRSGTGCAKPDSSARWVGWPRWITR